MKTIIALAIALFATTARADVDKEDELKLRIYIIANTYCTTLAAGIDDADERKTFHTQCMGKFAMVSALGQEVGRSQAITIMLETATAAQ